MPATPENMAEYFAWFAYQQYQYPAVINTHIAGKTLSNGFSMNKLSLINLPL